MKNLNEYELDVKPREKGESGYAIYDLSGNRIEHRKGKDFVIPEFSGLVAKAEEIKELLPERKVTVNIRVEVGE